MTLPTPPSSAEEIIDEQLNIMCCLLNATNIENRTEMFLKATQRITDVVEQMFKDACVMRQELDSLEWICSKNKDEQWVSERIKRHCSQVASYPKPS